MGKLRICKISSNLHKIVIELVHLRLSSSIQGSSRGPADPKLRDYLDNDIGTESHSIKWYGNFVTILFLIS